MAKAKILGKAIQSISNKLKEKPKKLTKAEQKTKQRRRRNAQPKNNYRKIQLLLKRLIRRDGIITLQQ